MCLQDKHISQQANVDYHDGELEKQCTNLNTLRYVLNWAGSQGEILRPYSTEQKGLPPTAAISSSVSP